MAKMDWKASLAVLFQDQPNWLKRSFLLALLVLALTLALLGLRPSPHMVAAQGAVQIASREADLDVVIARASSDDPPRHKDPGQELDVAECRLSLKQGKLAKLIIYDGYPGYTCTLQVTVHNRNTQTVRLQEAQVSASPGLEITRVDRLGTALIPAGKKSQHAFRILIRGQAAELAKLEFQISEVYIPAEASPPGGLQ